MLLILSDTHSIDGHRLTDHLRKQVAEAEMVVHAGDFMRASVLDSFLSVNGSFYGVYGNNDDAAIRSRLPSARTIEYNGFQFAVTHTRRGGETALTMFGRERNADAVIFGHSHKPAFERSGLLPLINPGSHAQPRGYRPGYATLEPMGDALAGGIHTPDGETFVEFTIEP